MTNSKAQLGKMTEGKGYTDKQTQIINNAIGILETRIESIDTFTDSATVKRYCQLHLATRKDEHFGCLFLDNQHRLLKFEVMFKGTVDGAAVYARPIVRRALELNAAAIIVTHNHPSGISNPSQADIAITQKLRSALTLVDVRVLDHIIVGTESVFSMAESGQL